MLANYIITHLHCNYVTKKKLSKRYKGEIETIFLWCQSAFCKKHFVIKKLLYKDNFGLFPQLFINNCLNPHTMNGSRISSMTALTMNLKCFTMCPRAFSSPEAIILLVSTKNREFWSLVMTKRILGSGNENGPQASLFDKNYLLLFCNRIYCARQLHIFSLFALTYNL